jgi:hypothetical protein
LVALVGCAGGGFSVSFPTGSTGALGPEVSVSLESEPSGAEVRASSTGQTCRTPCTLRVPSQDFSVTFALEGYESETVPVRVSVDASPRSDGEAGAAVSVEPNPVMVQLTPSKPARVAQSKKTAQAARKGTARPSSPAPARTTSPGPATAPGTGSTSAPPAAPWPPR